MTAPPSATAPTPTKLAEIRPLAGSGSRPNPYVGPRAFRNGEKLFGRGHETDSLMSALLAERIILLHSQSGAGKTSLLQANLLPRLVEEGFDILPPARVSRVPAEIPAGKMCRYALSTMIDWECERSDPRTPDELSGLNLDAYLSARPRQHAGAPEVIIFDQFEELLTLDPTDLTAKHEFCRQAGLALGNRMRWAIIAMREEFIGALDPFLDYFPTRLAARYRLELLSPESARVSIAGPAESEGVKFAPGAVDRLVSDLRKVRQQITATTVSERDGPFIEPVQLQVVCTRLWENLPADATVVTAEQVGAVGNVDDALGDYYARAVSRAAAVGGCQELDVRRWVESALIVNRVRAQALQGSEASHNVSPAAVRALEDAYVVRREERRGGIWYELAHDRLVTPVLEDNERWRDESMTDLEKLAMRWVEEGKPNRLLAAFMEPRTLRDALNFTKRFSQPGRPVSPELREYVSAARKFMYRRVAMIYGGAALLAVGFVFWQERSHMQSDAKILKTKNDSLAKVVDSLNHLRETVYAGWGLEQTTAPSIVVQSIAADAALKTATRAAPVPARAQVTIEYYYKRQDPEKVEYVLRGLGYKVTVAQARADEVATNAISYGPQVPLSDVRIIALALARAGAQLKRICPFQESAGRANVVQVIGSSLSDRFPTLRVDALQRIGENAIPPCPTGPSLAR